MRQNRHENEFAKCTGIDGTMDSCVGLGLASPISHKDVFLLFFLAVNQGT